jgi:hypothetical protein
MPSIQTVDPRKITAPTYIYDSGGLLYPGRTLADNRSSEIEYVLTRMQLENAVQSGSKQVSGRGEGVTDTLLVKYQGDGTPAGQQSIEAISDHVQRKIYERVGDKKIKWG